MRIAQSVTATGDVAGELSRAKDQCGAARASQCWSEDSEYEAARNPAGRKLAAFNTSRLEIFAGCANEDWRKIDCSFQKPFTDRIGRTTYITDGWLRIVAPARGHAAETY